MDEAPGCRKNRSRGIASIRRITLSSFVVLALTIPTSAFAQSESPAPTTSSASPPAPPTSAPWPPSVETHSQPATPWLSGPPSAPQGPDALELRRIHRVLRWGADLEATDRGLVAASNFVISLGYTGGAVAQLGLTNASGSTSNGIWAAPMFAFGAVYLLLGAIWVMQGPIASVSRSYDDALVSSASEGRALIPRLRPALALAGAGTRTSSNILFVTSAFSLLLAGGYIAMMAVFPSTGNQFVGWGISFGTMGVASLAAALTLRLRDTASRTRAALDSGFEPPVQAPSPLLVPTMLRSEFGTMMYGVGAVF